MKTLIVYYSLENNCRQLADLMAPEIGATLQELRLVKGNPPQNFFGRYYQGGKGSFFKETPELQPPTANAADFDLVIVGTPVWAWNMTPAVRSFLTSTDFTGKKAAVFAMYRGTAGVTLSAMKKLIEQRGGTVTAQAGFRDLRIGDAENTKKRALEWARGLAYRE